MFPAPSPRRLFRTCLLLTPAAVLTALVPLRAEDLSEIYTQPTPPPREALDRLNLKVGWSLNLPVEGKRDGLFSVQVLEKELFIQTRSGLIVVVNADTGEIKWKTRVGTIYRPVHPVGYNSKTMFVVSDTDLYALERSNGQLIWQYRMRSSAAAPPVADEERLYLNVGAGRLDVGAGRLYVYHIPTKFEIEDYAKGITDKKIETKLDPRAIDFRKPYAGFVRGRDIVAVGPLSTGRQASQAETMGIQPSEEWSHITESRVEKAPLLISDTLMLPGANGALEGMATAAPKVAYTVPLESHIAYQPGQSGKIAYVAAQDSNLYAVNIESGHVTWRFTDGAVFSRAPAVTDKDIFLATQRKGFYCVGREDGDLKWRSPTGGRFLAANPKFVYAADRSDRFLVLDRERGTVLSTYDMRDFVFPIANERTDRVYLAAHNGLILCLHDRDYDKPLVMKKEEKPAAKPGEKPAEKPGDKPSEKPGEKPKEKPGEKPAEKDKPLDKDGKEGLKK
jgi:outer membrane protein assembly factor BamB